MPLPLEKLREKYRTDPEYRERQKARARAYYQAHRDVKKIYERQRYLKSEEHREHMKQKARAWNRGREQRARKELMTLLGFKCQRCGEDDPQVLVVHHPNGRGDIKWRDFYRDLRAYKKAEVKLELLCANCHARLHWNREEEERNPPSS